MKRTKLQLKGEDPTKQKVYIGIDNGVTGTIGIILGNESVFFKTPTFKQQNYTKKKANITRVDAPRLLSLLKPYEKYNVMCVLERPMVQPKGRWVATQSALRALEATLTVVEVLGYAYDYMDSKEWQKALLPKGSKGDQLKVDSKTIGCRLFPKHAELINKHTDADGMLMAEYCRRKF